MNDEWSYMKQNLFKSLLLKQIISIDILKLQIVETICFVLCIENSQNSVLTFIVV